ncbi:hypothetical protein O181_121540 [Austropuccinia psidii MF-1]|uniref:Uncharacterized protein n=1 Tax=Austropuccinia psidii MF-1 TaxID=1389203 RepID=A0A9Q3Q2E9_9BASI|nr:hypothetical protein [Austropuccinia psidii MF-1]
MYGEFWIWANSWPHGTPGSPEKLGPGGPFWSLGPPIAPTDHRPRCTVHGQQTVGPQKTKMAKNGHTSSNHQNHQEPQKGPKRHEIKFYQDSP